MKTYKEYLGSEEKDINLYHSNGKTKLNYFEFLSGYWAEYTYDSNDNELTYKESLGFWCEYTYDSNGNELTYKDSSGTSRGFNIEEMTMEEVCKALGKEIKIKK